MIYLSIVEDIPETIINSLEKVVLSYANSISDIDCHLQSIIQQYLKEGSSLLTCFQCHAMITRLGYHSIDLIPLQSRFLSDILTACHTIQENKGSSIVLLRVLSTLFQDTLNFHQEMVQANEYIELWRYYWKVNSLHSSLEELLGGLFRESLPFARPCLFAGLLEIALQSDLFPTVSIE